MKRISIIITIVILFTGSSSKPPAGVVTMNIQLDGSKSFDPDGYITKYNWVQIKGSKIKISGANTVKPTISVPVKIATYSFELTVADDKGAAGKDTMNIVIKKK